MTPHLCGQPGDNLCKRLGLDKRKNGQPSTKDPSLQTDKLKTRLPVFTGLNEAAKGVKPIGLSQWQRENFYLYGVVEPLSGYSFFYDFSHLDGDCFQRFLELLSKDIGDDIAFPNLPRYSNSNE